MFSMNLLRRLGHDKVSTKDEASRTGRVRARRNLGGLETLEERQLLASWACMLVGDGTVVHGGLPIPPPPKGCSSSLPLAGTSRTRQRSAQTPRPAPAVQRSPTSPSRKRLTRLQRPCSLRNLGADLSSVPRSSSSSKLAAV
jgi:hypothetical protein